MNEPLFTVSREDWSLHRKGYQDQTRHQQKVREAVKQILPDLITDESIIPIERPANPENPDPQPGRIPFPLQLQ